jgi:hypothetical protein
VTYGAILGPGDTVRTGTDARAVLTYFEGSTVEIEPDAERTIDTAHANPDGNTVIIMKQDLGETWHSSPRSSGARPTCGLDSFWETQGFRTPTNGSTTRCAAITPASPRAPGD